MSLGTFPLLIDGERLGGTEETSALLRLTIQGRGAIRDEAEDQFIFPNIPGRGANISLPYTIELPTDVTSGVSTEIGYSVTVTTANGGSVSADFAAQAATTTPVPLTDLAETVVTPISDLGSSVAAAEAAQAAAETAAASVNREQASGVAGLTAAGKLYEARIPDRLSDATLSATYARRPTGSRVADLVAPVSIAHMGGRNLAPEETLEAYRAAVGYGADVLDGDANLLADGAMALMHDGTLDRTTSATGNVNAQTASSIQQKSVDAGSWFGGGWGNLKVPLVSDLFNEFGNRSVITLEAKSTGDNCAARLAELTTRFGVQESVILATSFWADIPTLVATGAHVQYVMTTGTEKTPAQVAAAGVTSVACDWTAVAMDATLITAFHAAGVKVYGFTINRQKDAAAWLAKGGDGWFSDDPIYAKGASNSYRYLRTANPWDSGTWYHGDLNGTSGKRGTIDATRKARGWAELTNAGWVGALVGGVCPVGGSGGVPGTYTIEVDLNIDASVDTGRYAGVFFCSSDDRDLNGSGASVAGNNYYRTLLTVAGALQLQKFTDNVAVGSPLNFATTALTLPTMVTLKIEVTPTNVAVTRVDTGNKLTLSDTAYRGGYLHIGVVGATCYFKVRRTV